MPRGRPPKLVVAARQKKAIPTTSTGSPGDVSTGNFPVLPNSGVLASSSASASRFPVVVSVSAPDHTVVPPPSVGVSIQSAPLPKDAPSKKPYVQALKSSGKGMCLSYVKSDAEVIIDLEDIAEEVDYWSTTLVGTLMGRQTTIVELNSLISKHWNHITTPESPTVTKELTAVTHVPVWVIFPNLDPCFWSKSALSKVASFVGKPICADELTTTKSKIVFARILVEVDLSKDLPKGMALHTPYRGHTQDRCNRNKPKPVYKPKEASKPVQEAPLAPLVKDKEKGVSPKRKVVPESQTEVVVIQLDNQFTSLEQEEPNKTQGEIYENTVQHTGAGNVSVEIEPGGISPPPPFISMIIPPGMRSFSSYSLATNYDSHHGGRIWLLWNPATVQISMLSLVAQFIHYSLFHFSTQKTIMLTVVYAFNRAPERIDLWKNLCSISTGISAPWVCLGDFNVTLNLDEMVGCVSPDRDIQEFRDCLSFCALEDHPYIGGIFTWHNKQDQSPRCAKLDRLLVNPNWFFNLNVVVSFLPAGISDHTLILLTMATDSKLYRPFKYLNCWALSPSFIDREKSLVKEYVKLKNAELKILAQKSKIQHLYPSDSNTRYFYAGITARKVQNTIEVIEDTQGNLYQGHGNVAKAFLGYYQKMLDSSEPTIPLPDYLFHDHILDHPSQLDHMVTLSEIEAALFSIDKNKSPGVDGYTSGFFKDTWHITGPAFVAAVTEFFQKGVMSRAANSTLVSLIPKSTAPKSVADFRPIS
ncbi:uncharacterized protein LOC141602132 [Silene latifolia]|uniref:uncharacterized protein LOC141602132 n=1 Tax=Silene latifolia TaxID=37657 RepID=UPI003D771B6F